MSYKITRPPIADKQFNSLFDDLKYAVNDLDRRIRNKETEKPAEQIVYNNIIQSDNNNSSSSSNNQLKRYQLTCRINTYYDESLDSYIITDVHLPSNTLSFIQNAVRKNPYMTYIKCPVYIDFTDWEDVNISGYVFTGMTLLLAPQMAVSESEDITSEEHFSISMYFGSLWYYDIEHYPVFFSMYITDNYNHTEADIRIYVKSIDISNEFFRVADNYQVVYDLPEVDIE